MPALFKEHVSLTAKVMDLELQRQNVVMSNLANISTPNYKARTLEFEKELQEALNLDARGKLSKTDKGHIPAVFDVDGFGPNMRKAFQPRVVFGADNVNLDKEMAAMAKNNMHYTALASIIKSTLGGIQKAIAEGSK